MSLIQLSRSRGQQSAGARLCALYPPDWAVNFADGPVDLVRGPATVSRTGTIGVGTASGKHGPVVGISASGAFLDISDPGLTLVSTGEVCHFGVARFTSLDASYGGLFAVSDTSNNAAISLQRDGGSGNLQIFRGNAGGTILSGTVAALVDSQVHAFLIYSQTNASSSATELWVDGRLVASSASGTGGGAGASGSSRIRFFTARDGSTSYGSDGDYYAHAMWRRNLPDGFKQQITERPWDTLFEPRRIWVPVSTGGSTYNVDLTESATASDSATAAYIAAASVAESITAADSLAAATTWLRSLTEAATAAESITTAGTFAASITEAASTADALTSAVTWARALTEAASASDLAAAIRHAVAALTEAATASDSQTTGSIYIGSVTESASVADALTAAATLVALLTEVATASDAATSAATWVRLLTEPATAVDSVAGAQGATYTASVTEVLAAAELLAAVLGSTEALGRYTIAAKARRLTITAKPRRLEIRK